MSLPLFVLSHDLKLNHHLTNVTIFMTNVTFFCCESYIFCDECNIINDLDYIWKLLYIFTGKLECEVFIAKGLINFIVFLIWINVAFNPVYLYHYLILCWSNWYKIHILWIRTTCNNYNHPTGWRRAYCLCTGHCITSNCRQIWRPMSLIVSSIVGGVNEYDSIVNKCRCRWLDIRKDDHC